MAYVPGNKSEKMGSISMPRVFVKDVKDIRNGLVPTATPQDVRIYCLAVQKQGDQNREIRIPLDRCVPIEGYVYNQITDRYAVIGFDYLDLGFIRVAYKVALGGVGNWQTFIPMPEMVLKRYMNPVQRRILARYKAAFRDTGADVKYEYIQMLSAYSYG